MTKFEKVFMWLCILLSAILLAFAAYKTFTPREAIRPIETDAPIAQAFKCEKTLSYFAPTAQRGPVYTIESGDQVYECRG